MSLTTHDMRRCDAAHLTDADLLEQLEGCFHAVSAGGAELAVLLPLVDEADARGLDMRAAL